MPQPRNPEVRLPLKLTLAQRKILARVVPSVGDRLKLDEPNQRIIDFTVAELKALKAKTETAITRARTGYERRPLRLVLNATDRAIAQSQRLSATDTVYQFKITLIDSHPPIWRRIQVQDCILDKLHEHIQTAMGWTNSHLHKFQIGEQEYADPMLMEEDFEEFGYQDSMTTRISAILPKDGKRFSFQYEYDFGDSWQHEVLFAGIVLPDAKLKYPLCLEGARACPPEDCGGIWSYAEFIKAIQNPDNKWHKEMLRWIGGSFDPEHFDPAKATKEMRKGLPDDWRRGL
jgi:hypothetical protein